MEDLVIGRFCRGICASRMLRFAFVSFGLPRKFDRAAHSEACK